MSFERRFEQLWNQHDFDVPDAPVELCVYAQRFAEWLPPLLAEIERTQTLVAVNQGIVLVTRKYFEWRTVAPKSHRNKIGEQGHQCIFHVFETAILKLKMIELAIQPPPVVPPPPPPPSLPPPAPPKPPSVLGITLGEVLGED